MAIALGAMVLKIECVGGQVLGASGLETRPLSIEEGYLTDARQTTQIDMRGFSLLPGIVDVHGDGFERHVAPRRGAMLDVAAGIRAAEAEMAANGITTGVLAQFISWEGGLRGETFAEQVFCAMRDADTITDLMPQLRLETHLLDLFEELPNRISDWGIEYVVFNDHLPHVRLSEGRTPKRLVAQALKAARSPEAHLEILQSLHARTHHVPAALDALCLKLLNMGVQLGSHDDQSLVQRQEWTERGAEVAEFPETMEAVDGPGLVVLGAPNVVRGGSHNGNLAATDVVLAGKCEALASDYHYPSLRRAALHLADSIGLVDAWALISAGPAKVLGLKDRGHLTPGLRADVTILDAKNRLAGTVSGGRVSYLTGELAERFVGAVHG